MDQFKSQYENVVNNAQKSYEKLKNIFKQTNPNEEGNYSNNNLSIKEIDNKLFKHHDNYDIDEDEQEASNQTTSKQSNSNKSATKSQSENEYTEAEEDIWEVSHRVLCKKSIIDIEHMPYVNFIKRKKIENVFSFMGLSKPNYQYKEIKYIALLDESFIYMIKMTEKENNQNNFNKKIGNHYDIRLLSNIHMKDDKEYKVISVLFIVNNDIDDYKSLVKEFYFVPSEAKRFIAILKFYLNKWKIPIHFKDNSIYL